MRLPRFPLAPPWRGSALALLCLAYVFAGLTGHGPWKHEDVEHFSRVWQALQQAHWPRLLAWHDQPPLYYWLASLSGRWLGPDGLHAFELHDAIRLSTGLFALLFLYLLARASRTLYVSQPRRLPGVDDEVAPTLDLQLHDTQAGNVAALIAIGCLGLLLPLHETQPLSAYLAAAAATYWGLARISIQPHTGALLTALGMTAAVLAAGLTALLHLAPLLLLLPLHPHWRQVPQLRALGYALLLAIALLLMWTASLWLADNHRPFLWWQAQLAHWHYQAQWWRHLPQWLELLAWFAWPALPMALWALWLQRQRLTQANLFLPLLGCGLSLMVLLLGTTARPIHAVPLLVPLILLAANSQPQQRRGAASAFNWFAMMSFTLLAGLIWLGSSALYTGLPPKIAHNLLRLTPGFEPRLAWPTLLLAGGISLAWLWLILTSPRTPWRAISHWAAGTALVWLLLSSLWMPWIDYRMSYRSVALELGQAIDAATRSATPRSTNTSQPASTTRRPCLTTRHLGKAQHVSLAYFADLDIRIDANPRQCPLLLIQARVARNSKSQPAAVLDDPHSDLRWRLRWQGGRPGDRQEQLRLYQLDTLDPRTDTGTGTDTDTGTDADADDADAGAGVNVNVNAPPPPTLTDE